MPCERLNELALTILTSSRIEGHMRRMKFALVLVMTVVAAHPVWAGSDDIIGIWFNQDKDAKIEIFKCGDNYCGKIVWLKEPVYPTGSKLGTPGTPKLDHYNPNSTHKRDPLLGLQIVQ